MFACLMVKSLLPIQIYAQESNLRCKWIDTKTEVIFLDSLLIAPETTTFQHANIEYSFDVNSSALKLKTGVTEDSLFICYRIFLLSSIKSMGTEHMMNMIHWLHSRVQTTADLCISQKKSSLPLM